MMWNWILQGALHAGMMWNWILQGALHLRVTGDMAVMSTGRILGSGGGYAAGIQGAPGVGPGAPTSSSGQHGGGSHGGRGGYSPHTSDDHVYGDLFAPVTMGSGSSTTASGGAALHLEVSGTLVLNGTISMDGQSGGYYQKHPGGAGGSVWLTAGVLAGGGGAVSARGGDSGQGSSGYGKGGGGGGRIALYCERSTCVPTRGACLACACGPGCAVWGHIRERMRL